MNALINKLNLLPGNKKYCQLQILGFPCNQFMYQEPGRNAKEIYSCLKYIRPGNGYVPNFPLFEKLDVNGYKEDRIYTWLKAQCPRPEPLIVRGSSALWSPIKSTDIRWNFEKFLMDENGVPYRRFTESTYPMALESDILRLMERCRKRMAIREKRGK